MKHLFEPRTLTENTDKDKDKDKKNEVGLSVPVRVVRGYI
jgi:hypothetical protein